MTTRKEVCRWCKWWDVADNDRDDAGNETAVCRALSPVMLYPEEPTEPYAAWPFTCADDWCPKFKHHNPNAQLRTDQCAGCQLASGIFQLIMGRLAYGGMLGDVTRPGYERERLEAAEKLRKEVQRIINTQYGRDDNA